MTTIGVSNEVTINETSNRLTFPGSLVYVEVSNWMFKITDVCKTVGTEGTQFRELVMRTKYFLDV
jgi:hypothetical protein